MRVAAASQCRSGAISSRASAANAAAISISRGGAATAAGSVQRRHFSANRTYSGHISLVSRTRVHDSNLLKRASVQASFRQLRAFSGAAGASEDQDDKDKEKKAGDSDDDSNEESEQNGEQETDETEAIREEIADYEEDLAGLQSDPYKYEELGVEAGADAEAKDRVDYIVSRIAENSDEPEEDVEKMDPLQRKLYEERRRQRQEEEEALDREEEEEEAEAAERERRRKEGDLGLDDLMAAAGGAATKKAAKKPKDSYTRMAGRIIYALVRPLPSRLMEVGRRYRWSNWEINQPEHKLPDQVQKAKDALDGATNWHELKKKLPELDSKAEGYYNLAYKVVYKQERDLAEEARTEKSFRDEMLQSDPDLVKLRETTPSYVSFDLFDKVDAWYDRFVQAFTRETQPKSEPAAPKQAQDEQKPTEGDDAKTTAAGVEEPPMPSSSTSVVKREPTEFEKAWQRMVGDSAAYRKVLGIRGSLEDSENPLVQSSMEQVSSLKARFGRLLEETDQGAALGQIKRLQPEFDQVYFVDHYLKEELVPDLIKALCEDDVETLQRECSPLLVNMLSATFEQRKAQGWVNASELLDVRMVELQDAALFEDEPALVIHVAVHQTNVFKDAVTGAIVQGVEDTVMQVHYIIALQLTEDRSGWVVRELSPAAMFETI